jgi:Salmonella virulence plasmid 65kDa B protein
MKTAQSLRLEERRMTRWSGFLGVVGVLSAHSLAFAQPPNQYVSYTLGAPGNISEVAIKGDIGSGSVQPGGTYNYAFPIEVPPGPRGTAPGLQIVYSGEGNGWVGKNWSFGFGAITRDTREGVPTSLLNPPGGAFMLNGVALVARSGNRYRTEIEAHQFITYDSASNTWTVKNPDGRVSAYSVPVAANAVSGTREWLLGSVTDTMGNQIRYLYQWNNPGTTLYPQAIVWGSSGSNTT